MNEFYMNVVSGEVMDLELWSLRAQEFDQELQEWIDNKEIIEVVKDETTGEWVEL